MKNLKLFVFALCAVLLSVVTVNADSIQAKDVCSNNQNATYYVEYGNNNFECTNDFNAILHNANAKGVASEVILLKDHAFGDAVTIENDLTINLNGHKLTTAAGGKNFTVKGANVTIKNGKLDLLSGDSAIYVDSSAKASTLTIADDVTVKATFTGVSAIIVNDASNTTVVNVNGTWTVVNEIVSCSNGKDEKLTVNLNANVKATNLTGTNFLVAVDAGTSIVNVNGGTYTSNKAAFDVKNGTLNIKGGTITAKGDNAILVHEAGSDSDGEPYNAVLNVTGGEIIATMAGKYSVYFQVGSGKTTGSYKISGGKFTSGKDSEGNQLPALYINDPDFLDNHANMITNGQFTGSIVGNVTVGGTVYKKAAAAAAILTGNAKTTNANGVVTVGGKDEGTSKPGAKPGDEPAPNTFDAGLVYMGLALSAIGASVVSVRKLRNN